VDHVIDTEQRRPLLAVMTAFAAHAFEVGALGPWIPAIRDRAGVGVSGLGVAFGAMALGLLTGTRIGARLARTVGPRRTVRAAVPALGVGFAALPIVETPAGLVAAFAYIGVVNGLLDVAMNEAAVVVEARAGRRLMSRIHAAWSISTLVGAAVASVAIAVDVPFAGFAIVVGIALALATASVLRAVPADAAAHLPGEGGEPRVDPRALVVALCAIGAASFFVEGGALEWSAVYLRDDTDAAAAVAGLGVVAFTAGMAASRVAGDRLATRFRASSVVRWGAWTAAAALVAGLGIGGTTPAVAAFVILGLCMGPVVPLAFSTAGRVGVRSGRSALSLVVTCSYGGSVVGPLVLGTTAHVVGLRVALLIPAAMAFLVGVLARAVDARPPDPTP
jgi:MFS family permease